MQWRATLENYVFEYGKPPPAPPARDDPEAEVSAATGGPKAPAPVPLSDEQCETLATSATTDDLATFKTAAHRNGVVSDQLHTVMDGSYSNLLHLCCLWGSDKVLSFLIDSNAININSANSKGETPTFVACANGRLSCLQLLLLHEADHDKAANGGVRPCHVAAAQGSADALGELLALGSGGEADEFNRTCLHYACFRGGNEGRLDCLLMLLDSFFNLVDEREGANGDTALMLAIRCEWRDGVMALLQGAAGVGVENFKGESAWTISRGGR